MIVYTKVLLVLQDPRVLLVHLVPLVFLVQLEQKEIKEIHTYHSEFGVRIYTDQGSDMTT